MVDPPASEALERSPRRTLEPDALSPLAGGDCVNQFFVETAPSGCTEVSLHNHSSQEPSLFDDSHNVVEYTAGVDEERDDRNNYSDQWIPPNDLSALRLFIKDTRQTPPIPLMRRNRTGSASSAGSLNSAGKSNINTKQAFVPQGTDSTTPANQNGSGQHSLSLSSSSSSIDSL